MRRCANNGRKARQQGMEAMTSWTTPQLCEICVGMEVTAYMSAEF
ncbi:pyrroloquinoline quinone precursor peptide PqqA [Rhodoblastus acidophilus]